MSFRGAADFDDGANDEDSRNDGDGYVIFTWHPVDDVCTGPEPSSGGSSSREPDPDPAEGNTVHTQDGGQLIVTVAEDGTRIRHLTLTDVSDPEDLPVPPPPAGLSLPHGLISFDVADVEPGATITVTIQLPGPADEYWKYFDGEWLQVEDAVFDGNSVSFTLTDGGFGDASGEANGYIVDPGAPVIRVTFTG